MVCVSFVELCKSDGISRSSDFVKLGFDAIRLPYTV